MLIIITLKILLLKALVVQGKNSETRVDNGLLRYNWEIPGSNCNSNNDCHARPCVTGACVGGICEFNYAQAKELKLVVLTDDYPDDISWKFYQQNETSLMQINAGDYTLKKHMYTHTLYSCDHPGLLEVLDKHEDGIVGGGYVLLEYNGVEIIRLNGYGAGTMERFQVCDIQNECISRDCTTKSCSNNKCMLERVEIITQNIRVEILTDKYPLETKWSLKEINSVIPYEFGLEYKNAKTLYETNTYSCFGTQIFTIYDDWGDGICCLQGDGYYKVYLDDQLIIEHSQGKFEKKEHEFYVDGSYPPSTNPSNQPSQAPSASPSDFPSDEPTHSPSYKPSTIPTSQPSFTPSAKPISSSIPSSAPSLQPSTIPTSQPSMIPSSQPSFVPTVQVSGEPTHSPFDEVVAKIDSNSPTYMKNETDAPTIDFRNVADTDAPTIVVSDVFDTDAPVLPSAISTSAPSQTLSSRPSSVPSFLPSTYPTRQPSITPSVTKKPPTNKKKTKKPNPAPIPSTISTKQASISPSVTKKPPTNKKKTKKPNPAPITKKPIPAPITKKKTKAPITKKKNNTKKKKVTSTI